MEMGCKGNSIYSLGFEGVVWGWVLGGIQYIHSIYTEVFFSGDGLQLTG